MYSELPKDFLANYVRNKCYKVYISTCGYSRNNGFPVEFVNALNIVELFFVFFFLKKTD